MRCKIYIKRDNRKLGIVLIKNEERYAAVQILQLEFSFYLLHSGKCSSLFMSAHNTLLKSKSLKFRFYHTSFHVYFKVTYSFPYSNITPFLFKAVKSKLCSSFFSWSLFCAVWNLLWRFSPVFWINRIRTKLRSLDQQLLSQQIISVK